MEKMWYFSRVNVIKEQATYIKSEHLVPDYLKYANTIQEWLDKEVCYYCGNPWTILYNDLEKRLFICNKKSCKTMARLKYVEFEITRYKKGIQSERQK